ncbi:hypothetical protein KS4_07620 [Poriferisphaera corsica]|uniref:Damage-control phosphatase ARMT1-like metal-binding domain-containing protein n=1 Tax=Poriferisphaera corsica TaxID=2528020 RepID=A0A517YR72_9BACT|nr:ARMT1-like domain-containing protein [Poriferisphaera corsica]QDU32728.1 hypothetical protein KS4_07620 [Poriferisphaera corsica]
MRTYLDCIPCFVKQALGAARQVTDDEVLIERVMKRVCLAASELSMTESSPVMGQKIHRIIREETGCGDPYAEIKKLSNEMAMRMVDGAKAEIEAAKQVGNEVSGFEVAVRYAIAGNSMDFAIYLEWDEKRLNDSLAVLREKVIDKQAVADLWEAIGKAEKILVLADNAGEIVFDRLLMETLPAKVLPRITYAVKGSAVINDALREDADEVGVSDLVTVIDNGTDAPGTVLEQCSDEFMKAYHEADVVISKGQANYETLRASCEMTCSLSNGSLRKKRISHEPASDCFTGHMTRNDATCSSGCDREVYFLLQVKCPIIGKYVDQGKEVGDWVVQRYRP